MPIKVKCSCGNVMNTEFGAICTQCKQKLNIPGDGMLYLYRKGSPIGIAGDFGLIFSVNTSQKNPIILQYYRIFYVISYSKNF